MSLQRDQAREDAQFKVLRILARDPRISQRELADELGISLGATNYILRGLVDRGLVTLDRFRHSADKRRYVYVLTPGGLAAKSAIARRFLSRKRAEYLALKREIEELGSELRDDAGDGNEDLSDQTGHST
ncbi:MarR family EPS-associated transcriptional regulator [Porphyrobacter sp. AAP60]|uniref:MarR family EPS-associated transcriptional regulator n=1 Tax=Porphyrobacter sp. AAP60 TaxID=1523423 RepID=UPI0006B89D81|nr:MarR family EPS-associated transcriptional regulator [Porphyrobacter sp. AAP60]KPF63271.1 hypothetical protein IP79_10300 [Porphyrobacter sp. AAP60]